ncbi:DUF6286 domain-containing protein [Arthrobacter pityocampae]|uniref:DUF6286 domain-containing protein n=1 Tax=Arthrobacter pityocampae TaxID=547334 RepID=UPI003735975C
MSSTTIRRRPARTIPAVLCAALLLGVASTAVWTGVTALSGDAAFLDAARRVGASPWSSQAVLVAAALAALAGALLVVAALVPGRYNAYLIDHDGIARAALRNGGLETLLTDRANTIDGVDTVRTTLAARTVDVHIATYLLDRNDLRATVTGILQHRLDELGLTRTPRVSVSVSTHKR